MNVCQQIWDTSLPAEVTELLMRLLDELDYGLLAISHDAQLRFANRVARRACEAGAVIRIIDHQVRATHAMDQPAFQQCIDAARRDRRTLFVPAGPALARPVAVVPLTRAVAGPHDGPGHVLLILGRERSCEPVSLSLFARLYRVTGAEASVLRQLCDGLRPQQIAERSRVELSTVRTQIGSLRAKTGATSIGDLVRTASMLPPIVEVIA